MKKLLSSPLAVALSSTFVMSLSLSGCATEQGARVNGPQGEGTVPVQAGAGAAAEGPNSVKITGKAQTEAEKEAEKRAKQRQMQSMTPPSMACRH